MDSVKILPPCKRLKIENESDFSTSEKTTLEKLCGQSESALATKKHEDQPNCSTSEATTQFTQSEKSESAVVARSQNGNPKRYEYAGTENELEKDDSNYFRCYADLSIHRVMIGDYSRTQTYRRAILTNYKIFHQKVVLDVGAGTGILSLFCAQAGAKKVYAVEASGIAREAQKVVASNGYANKITVIEDKIEDAKLPEKVDIIVSEWMGYMLMYESMLPSFLFARDKWLKKDGHLFPDEVKIYIAPIQDPQEYEYSVEFWKKVEDAYKVDMSALASVAAEQMRAAVHVMSVDPASILSHASCVKTMHLATVEREFSQCAQGSFSCESFGSATVHGFVIWFTVHFPNNVILSTSPYERETHWEQSVLYIPPEQVEQDTVISGNLWIRKGEVYHRFLDIELDYQVDNGERKKMKYKMKD
ncbi:Protein arginine N-methyltransferase 6 [Araneus ventricosus]|uniref:Protein arginine N-methyltransferase 6 n=1 Tax=Araneus ventricosus TaxID=182803 RepID=A0A4Y2K4W5_ARAVE|nr:Protein arginine N-methyltransferase 6 [Araneus ventricosus]